jgi:O-antigen ligase
VLETVGVLPGAFPRSGTIFNRAALGFGQPNELGMYLALSVPLIVSRVGVSRGFTRLLWLGCLAGAALGLVGTFSRASWVGLVIGVGVLFSVGAARTALRIWVVIAFAAVVVDLGSGGALTDTAVRTVGDWILEQRAALLLAGVLMFLDRPWLGFGPGGFAEQVEQYAPLVPELSDIQPTPHNAYVQMAAEAGIVGLLAMLAFMWAVFRIVRRATLRAQGSERRLRLTLLWSLAVIAIASNAMWPFSHGVGEAVVLVLALACTGPAVRSEPPHLPTRTAP